MIGGLRWKKAMGHAYRNIRAVIEERGKIQYAPVVRRRSIPINTNETGN